jgi:hypothetical protein
MLAGSEERAGLDLAPIGCPKTTSGVPIQDSTRDIRHVASDSAQALHLRQGRHLGRICHLIHRVIRPNDCSLLYHGTATFPIPTILEEPTSIMSCCIRRAY